MLEKGADGPGFDELLGAPLNLCLRELLGLSSGEFTERNGMWILGHAAILCHETVYGKENFSDSS